MHIISYMIYDIKYSYKLRMRNAYIYIDTGIYYISLYSYVIRVHSRVCIFILLIFYFLYFNIFIKYFYCIFPVKYKNHFYALRVIFIINTLLSTPHSFLSIISPFFFVIFLISTYLYKMYFINAMVYFYLRYSLESNTFFLLYNHMYPVLI